MKFKNFKQVDNKIHLNAESPFINFIYGLKAKFIIRKIRKNYKIPKSIPISYTVVVSYDFNVGEQ